MNEVLALRLGGNDVGGIDNPAIRTYLNVILGRLDHVRRWQSGRAQNLPVRGEPTLLWLFH